ncbi:hypothetical protein Pfo_007073 [Paulownia fortunei]|nr:hypothetical protein Pfo_007073 [Paulownia fortunei]
MLPLLILLPLSSPSSSSSSSSSSLSSSSSSLSSSYFFFFFFIQPLSTPTPCTRYCHQPHVQIQNPHPTTHPCDRHPLSPPPPASKSVPQPLPLNVLDSVGCLPHAQASSHEDIQRVIFQAARDFRPIAPSSSFRFLH